MECSGRNIHGGSAEMPRNSPCSLRMIPTNIDENSNWPRAVCTLQAKILAMSSCSSGHYQRLGGETTIIGEYTTQLDCCRHLPKHIRMWSAVTLTIIGPPTRHYVWGYRAGSVQSSFLTTVPLPATSLPLIAPHL